MSLVNYPAAFRSHAVAAKSVSGNVLVCAQRVRTLNLRCIFRQAQEAEELTQQPYESYYAWKFRVAHEQKLPLWTK